MNHKDIKFIVTTPIPIMMERLERSIHILMHREEFHAYRYLSQATDYTLIVKGTNHVEITLELHYEE
jgi:hypothetical protein